MAPSLGPIVPIVPIPECWRSSVALMIDRVVEEVKQTETIADRKINLASSTERRLFRKRYFLNNFQNLRILRIVIEPNPVSVLSVQFSGEMGWSKRIAAFDVGLTKFTENVKANLLFAGPQ